MNSQEALKATSEKLEADIQRRYLPMTHNSPSQVISDKSLEELEKLRELQEKLTEKLVDDYYQLNFRQMVSLENINQDSLKGIRGHHSRASHDEGMN